ncbi:protein FAR-RED IMPAIRED RESPONSE 1-like [Spinacia oleracea]|uniref:Protein FAR-RED IMPAIRED RESPONSE 1-like n=1 Tax=Spinacia oleracea TaxID=3562 RepID=A0ABM3R6S1_SPIOL|nr:protein FAR-RED IMPAIRED RESPONSE 1-like [Spinacia oleracea]
MPISVKDLRNIVAKEKKLKMRGGDAKDMFDYFDKMTAGNQNFFHRYRLNSKNRLTDVMWVDARSRVAYQDFGDVVCFDSTYVTNNYELPFSNFVGVNHHGQTILLGCALVSHEDTETFVWLFKTWLHCMGGKAPISFLTNQCATMRRALEIAMPMPTTKHRWCLWHILQKFGKKLEAGFEVNWTSSIELYGLGADDWLSGLYDQRHMWVPAYMKHLFWDGMKTTQRSESINNFFDKYVKRDTRLYQFAESYIDAMEHRVNTEKEADANTSINIRDLVTGFPAERVFQKLYKDAKFLEVQVQCMRVLYIQWPRRVELSEIEMEHHLEDRVWIYIKEIRKEIVTDKRRTYTVRLNIETKQACCDCKLFEAHGIICRHVINVFDREKITEVPEWMIPRRWRKDIHRPHTRVKVAYHDPSKTEEVLRYDTLLVKFESICLKAATLPEYVKIADATLDQLEIQLDENIKVNAQNKKNGQEDEGENQEHTPQSVNKGECTTSMNKDGEEVTSLDNLVMDDDTQIFSTPGAQH